YCAGLHSKQAGVTILLHRNLNFTLKEKVEDPRGRYIIVMGRLDLDDFVLVNLYAPNNEDPTFFTDLLPILSKFQSSYLIIGGDFNIVLNPVLDGSGCRIPVHTRTQPSISKLISDFHLVDIWRALHLTTKDYTFTSPVCLTSSRIDLILISSSLVLYTLSTEIHSLTSLPPQPLTLQLS
uniref:exodeoxyribonuclease III n=1 Tax=Latimeria chalumnae TaxID=7897 RepID=H3AWU3_LATCH